MDLVDFSEDVYNKIVADYKKMSEALDIKNVVFIPISAKDGDNVVNKSEKTPWYDGPTLLNYLETVPVGHKTVSDFFRFPVQYVIRPISSQFPDYRGYAGRVSGGIIRPGDKIRVLPSRYGEYREEHRLRRGASRGGLCPNERYPDPE